MKISIIIPAKDEQQRLPSFLRTVIDYCCQSIHQYEIIVVDDGSSDQTSAQAASFQKEFPSLKVITLTRNHGKGYAVKQGAFAAKGEIVLFLDADGSTGPQEIERHLGLLNEGYDIVIGSRVVKDEGTKVKTLLYRRWIGILFNFLVHCLLIKNIKDTQCGFKMFKASVVPSLFGRLYLDGFGFDMELLYLAQKMDLRIKEVAVNWSHVEGSKVNLISDSWRMFWNILQIKNWHYPPINMHAQHMSKEELASMSRQEKEHWWFKAKGEFFRKIISDYNLEGKYILDAGCGTGQNMEFLCSKGFYIGCDVMMEALEFCQVNGIRNLFQTNLQNVALHSKAFDVVISLDVIEHVPDASTVLRELKRVLKNDGVLIIAVPAFRFLWSPHDESLSHMRRYNKRDLRECLEDEGFEIQRIGYLYAVTFLPVMIIRLIRKIFRKKSSQSDTYDMVSPTINRFLFKLLQWEAKKLPYPWPFGTSIYAVASIKSK